MVELHFRVNEMPTDIASGRCHQIVVLEHLAKAAGRLGRRELSEGVLRRGIWIAVQQHLHVLARQTGAGTNEMTNKNLARRRSAAQPEGRIGFGDRLCPVKLAFVDELGDHQCRQPLSVRRDREFAVRVDGNRFAELTDAQPRSVNRLCPCRERKGGSRDAEFLH